MVSNQIQERLYAEICRQVVERHGESWAEYEGKVSLKSTAASRIEREAYGIFKGIVANEQVVRDAVGECDPDGRDYSILALVAPSDVYAINDEPTRYEVMDWAVHIEPEGMLKVKLSSTGTFL